MVIGDSKYKIPGKPYSDSLLYMAYV
jgi:hypothetical protein